MAAVAALMAVALAACNGGCSPQGQEPEAPARPAAETPVGPERPRSPTPSETASTTAPSSTTPPAAPPAAPSTGTAEESAAAEEAGPLPLIEASGLVVRGGGKVAVVCGDEARSRLWGVLLADPGRRWTLSFPPDTPSLDDLESLAPWKEHGLFAATSQSRTKTKEKTRPARNRLALAILTPDARRVARVRVYENLRGDLLRYLTVRCGNLLENVQALVLRGPNDGGLNVEGLAVWRGRLLLGLRSPLTPDGPIVVPVTNPETLFEGGAPPRFDAPVVLPTRPGEAIRDMAEGGKDTVLVLLGPGTDAPGPPQRVVRWWPAENRLEEVPVPALKHIERAEALSLDSDGRLLLVTDYRAPTPRQVFYRLQIGKP